MEENKMQVLKMMRGKVKMRRMKRKMNLGRMSNLFNSLIKFE